MFQHLARLLVRITPHSPPYLYSLIFRIWSPSICAELQKSASVEDSAPPKLPATHGSREVPLPGLGTAKCKSGISLATPRSPRGTLQSLPPMLRIHPAGPIRSCSKAPGVFSSNYRYPASSPEVHFHRANPRDSCPVITPFVHVGTYPTRNCATLGRL